MAELANWFPDDVTFKPRVNHDAQAQAYLRRSWERSVRDSPRASADASNQPSVVERLYACLEKVGPMCQRRRWCLQPHTCTNPCMLWRSQSYAAGTCIHVSMLGQLAGWDTPLGSS